MTKRWIALDVENNVGVLSKISGLFSGKAYNLDSLTVGTTEDETVSRITIGAICGDETFEQIKKQLNRMVDVIKVLDLSSRDIIRREILFIKIAGVQDFSVKIKLGLYKDIEAYKGRLVLENEEVIIVEAMNSEEENNAMVSRFVEKYDAAIIRSGSVAIEI